MTPHAFFPYIAGFVLASWLVALAGYLPALAKRLPAVFSRSMFIFGWLLLVGYIAWMWIALERPPMRTLGETRLWYALMLPGVGLLVEWRWQIRAMAVTAIMASVFLIINLLHPENFDKSLMPALQSPWFVPHVIVYMIGYATFGVAAAISLWSLMHDFVRRDDGSRQSSAEVQRLIYVGFPFLTAGLIFGALWAKVAWGHYWGWDPKETWAFLTWAMYLAYIHLKLYARLTPRTHLALVFVAFLVVLGCWFGVNALPTAQQSIHAYTE